MSEYTTIKLKKTTKSKLAKKGQKGESYDKIVLKLLGEKDGLSN